MSPQNNSINSSYLLEPLKCFYCSIILRSKGRLKFGKEKKRGVKTDKIFHKVGHKVIIHQNNTFFKFVHLFQIIFISSWNWLSKISSSKQFQNKSNTSPVIYMFFPTIFWKNVCIHFDHVNMIINKLNTSGKKRENRKFQDQVIFL